ncbi:hypothetical protein ACFYS8_24200 [Kitasatospora sp. NPDC004615]|uniref:hypothetical protein n=1 Tax=Kitasatospora sp. NPDC004615 TaxID=3364017 RepID=UPI00367723C6
MSVPSFADRRRGRRRFAAIGGLPLVAMLLSLAALLPGNDPQPTVAGAVPVAAQAGAPVSGTSAPTPTPGASPSANSLGSSGNSANSVSGGAAPSAAQNQLGGGVPSRPPRPVSYPSGTPNPMPTDGPCPFVLQAHTVVRCGAESGQRTLFKLDVSAGRDMVMIQVVSTLYGMAPRLFDPDGQQVQCNIAPDDYVGGPVRCVTNKAGTYTLQLINYGSGTLPIALSYLPVFSTDKCVTMRGTDTSLGNPTLYRGTVPQGMAGDCWVTDFAAGDVVRQLGTNLEQILFDATGQQVCVPGTPPVSGTDCKLTGTAPYRLVVQYGHDYNPADPGTPAYLMAMSRMSRPEGCLTVEPQTYGAALDLTDITRCRILRVPTDGRYSFRGTHDTGNIGGTLYRSDLSPICPSGTCDLTAGDYLYTIPPPIYQPSPFAMVFRADTETRGCTAGRDDQMDSGAPVETFPSAGQDICRTLPTASGQSVYVLNGTDKGETARYRVLDAAGTEQCHGFTVYDTYQVCRLTGTAPFRLTAEAQGPFNYRLLVQRVGETAGCTPWAAAEYGTGSGARTGLTGKPANGALESCFAVPADHPAAELIGYRVTGNRFKSVLHVVDSSGTEVCRINTGIADVCRAPAGRPYTAVLTYDSSVSDFTAVRRDATVSAPCDLPAATGQVGGPSAGIAVDSSTDAHCTTVGAAAADLLQMNSRTSGGRSAQLTVLDADGRTRCNAWETSCRVTGSTRYVTLVAARDSVDTGPLPGALDVWRLATAAGWAPECAAHPVSADGFDQRSGVLSDDAPLYCAVLDMKPGQSVDIATATDDYRNWSLLSMAGRENWADEDTAYKCVKQLGEVPTGFNQCTYNGTTTGHAVLLFSPGQAHTPLAYTLQGAKPGTGTAYSGIPQSLTPAVAVEGGYAEVTVHGTGLSLNSRLTLVPENTRVDPNLSMRPLWVSADGTELRLRVELGGASTVRYDLLVVGADHTDGVPSPGYLPKAFQVVKKSA